MKRVFAMKFSELDTTVQESIVDLLNNHIAATADILKQDRCLIPMLMIPESNQLVSLQSRDGSVDVDKAYTAVVGKLKNEAFTYALFSYSTRIGLAAGGETDALKTYIFTKKRNRGFFLYAVCSQRAFQKNDQC